MGYGRREHQCLEAGEEFVVTDAIERVIIRPFERARRRAN